ncbi:MAG: hypothetical protein GY917_11435, partial [Planctomycetaceae bacterium]|nr:hypothetical protein [Planctomycetaceae bacterium]
TVYLDVNGDGLLTNLDAMIVINRLNSAFEGQAGEGESPLLPRTHLASPAIQGQALARKPASRQPGPVTFQIVPDRHRDHVTKAARPVTQPSVTTDKDKPGEAFTDSTLDALLEAGCRF